MDKNALVESLRQKNFPNYILEAFRKVDREKFMPLELKNFSYEDEAFSIGFGQTISQPYTIAFMLSLLELDTFPNQGKILEIGSGSGYVLELLFEILKEKNAEIVGIERVEELYKKSKYRLKEKKNVKVIYGNVFDFIEILQFGKFDRIVISAAANKFEGIFVSWLNEDGIIVIPIIDSIFMVKKTSQNVIKKEFNGFSFVPLVEKA